jgi:uncharacterized membrane protein (UPF0127 family)
VLARNMTKDVVLADRLEWAGTSETRRKGLLGRTGLDEGEGIYIVPTQWIHMIGMKFAIDVAFLNDEGKVLAIHHGLKPNRFSRIVFRADGALELPEGTLKRTQTEVGDMVALEED